MKKHGFTLVELLAVIAILAILVLVAVPNVLGMFNQAKKDTFTTETKEMVRIAQQQYLTTFGKHTRYATVGSKDVPNASTNIIPCTTSTTLSTGQYCKIEKESGNLTSFVIEFSPSNGQVDSIKSTDGTYKYELTGGNYDATKVTATEVNATPSITEPAGPVSFSTDSWDVIVKAVKSGNTSKYNVGDTKEIDLGSYGVHTIRIANKSTPSECNSSTFSQTACGFVLEFADIITTGPMSSKSTNKGGWPQSEMYTFVNNSIYSQLPPDLKNNIINTVTISGYGNMDAENYTSTDKLYLLTLPEIYESISDTYDHVVGSTRQLDYYKNNGTTTSNFAPAVKSYNGSSTEWWLRSGFEMFDTAYTTINKYGYYSKGYSVIELGVSPAFRIG